MRPLFEFTRWFWSGAHPVRQWRYFVQGARNAEHARLKAFRLRVAPFALSQATLGLPWAGAALVAPSSAKAVLMLLGALKVVFGGAVSGALIHRFFPIRADETELRGRTFIGLSSRVRWDEITSVKHRQWLFAPYLLVSTGTRRNAIWLPLFLSEQDEFERRVGEWLAPEHPMRQFLATQRAPKSEVNSTHA